MTRLCLHLSKCHIVGNHMPLFNITCDEHNVSQNNFIVYVDIKGRFQMSF